MSVNIIDVLLAIVILISVANGWRRGFIIGMLDLLGWALSLLFGLRFYRPVAQWLAGHFHLWPEVWNRPIGFILCASCAGLLIYLLGHALLRSLPEGIHERRLNKLLGLLPGLASGLILTAILSSLLLAVPLSEGLSERVRDSRLVNRLAVYTERLETALVPVFRDAIAQTLNLLTIRPESNERVTLPYTVAKPKVRPDLEAEMLMLINRERSAAGLKTLVADPALTEVARQHSADMFARGYFAHVSPDGRDPFDRIRSAHIPFNAAGENLALAPTLQIAHTGLLNSPGHRANILSKDFGRVGIGIMDGGMRGLMVSQEFRN
jgi:uncharacterized protein YkwD